MSRSETELPVLAAKEIRKWISKHLTKVLGFEDEQIVDYIMSLDTDAALQEYVKAFFPKGEAGHFRDELIKRRTAALANTNPNGKTAVGDGDREKSSSTSQNSGPPKNSSKDAASNGANLNKIGDFKQRKKGRGKGGKGGSKFGNGKKKGPEGNGNNNNDNNNNATGKGGACISIYKGAAYKKAQQKKLKEQQKPSRKHDWYSCKDRDLLGNCLHCGKIICKTEGTKYCSFCQTSLANIRSKKQEQEYRAKLEAEATAAEQDGRPVPEEWKALQRKERLIEWDRTQAARSHVYDDQNDYFGDTSSAWMSEKERARAARRLARKEEKRAKRGRVKRFTVDLAGQRIMAECSSSDNFSSDDDDGAGMSHNDANPANPEDDPFFGSGNGGATKENDDFYANTTLHGRAREIYKLMKKQKRDGIAPPPSAASASSTLKRDGSRKGENATDGDVEADNVNGKKKKKKRSALQHADDAGPMLNDPGDAPAAVPGSTGRRLWKSQDRCLVVDQPFASLLVSLLFAFSRYLTFDTTCCSRTRLI